MSKTGPKTEAGLATVTQQLTVNPTAWTENPAAVAAIDLARRLRQTKHGLFSDVPIICKAESCPYAHTCPMMKVQMAPFGERCPIEIAALEDLFNRYCEELGINPEDPRQSIDTQFVRKLVDLDISILRCDKKMAWDADFIIENVVNMTEDGDPITRAELHPAIAYKEKLFEKKFKILQLLNSTRKDKIGSKITLELDASERAAQMLKVQHDVKQLEEDEDEAEQKYYAKLNKAQVIDVEPIAVDEDE